MSKDVGNWFAKYAPRMKALLGREARGGVYKILLFHRKGLIRDEGPFQLDDVL